MRNSIIQNKIVRRLAILVFWLIIWGIIYIVTDNEILMVSPSGVLKALAAELKRPDFFPSIGMTLLRVLMGYIFAIVLGTLISIFTYVFPIMYELLYPIISLIRSTPVVSFILLALVWLKTGTVPSFISFLMVFPVIWTNISEGIRRTDKGLLEVARMYRVKTIETIRNIYVPSVLPYFKTAAITGLSLAWKSEVAAEVIAVPAFSVGKHIYNSKIYLETPTLFAWTGVIIIMSVVMERAFVVLINRVTDRLNPKSRKSV